MVEEDLREMVLTEDLAKEFFEVGKQYEQEVFFTPMYPNAFDMCERIGVNFYKIRSQDQNNLILYRKLKKITGIQGKTIFVSCKNPEDTIFWNWSTYNKNIKFLYCNPYYPSLLKEYNDWGLYKRISGISDHTHNTELLEMFLSSDQLEWFEVHVCVNKDCHEAKWSKTLEELKEIIEK